MLHIVETVRLLQTAAKLSHWICINQLHGPWLSYREGA